MIASQNRDERKVMLHLGMHKTGSTSIQAVWNGYKDHRIEYAPLGRPNHSLVLQRAFLEGEGGGGGRGYRNADDRKRSEQHEAAVKYLIKVLERISHSVILSGEVLFRFDEAACRRCVGFLREHVGAVEALFYVRAPESYARSEFQQRLKMNEAIFNLDVPEYKKRSLNWIEALGEEPTCVFFDRSTLHDGDVVMDFGARLGLDLGWARARAHLQNRNTSLSAEATAALYLLRHRRGAPALHKGEITRQKWLIKVLEGFGQRRFDFGGNLMEAVLAKRAEEIAWIEGRLGRPFPKETVKDPMIFSSEREILDYGEAQAAPLREYLCQRGIIEAKVDGSTVDLLERVLSRAIDPLAIRQEVGLRKSLRETILRRLHGQFARLRG